jgi:hypothetical protein
MLHVQLEANLDGLCEQRVYSYMHIRIVVSYTGRGSYI